MQRTILAGIIASALISSPLFAEEKLERIEVWGTKVKSSSVYIGEDDIASKQVDHLSDLLRNIPGVDVGGTHSTNQRINIRGLDDTDLSVVIDGAVQNNYMFHHTGNLLINPDLLKSVDIQVGANSVVYAGLGGALEFRTKEAKDLLYGDQRFGALVLAGVNSNAGQRASLVGYGQLTDNIDALGYVSYLNKDNFDDGSGVEVVGVDGTVSNTMLKLGYAINDKHRVAVKYDAYRDDGDYGLRPDMGVRFTNARYGKVDLFDTHFDRDTLSLHYEVDLGASLNLRADAYRNEIVFARTPMFGTTPYDSRGESLNTGINVMANSALTLSGIDHQFTYGLSYIDVENNNRHINLSANTTSRGEEESTDLALFIQDAIYFCNGFTLTPGLRYNRYSKTSFSNTEETWNEWQTALAAEYRFKNGFSLQASTTGLFKGPQLGELFIYDNDTRVLNPNLKPETGSNNEFGFKYQVGNFLGADEFRVAVTRFDTKVNDYINEGDYPNDDCTGRGCTRWSENIGDVEIEGFEFSLLYAVGNFDALVTFATSDSEVVRFNEQVQQQPLDREVGDTTGLTLNYYLSTIDVAFSWHLQHASGEQVGETFKRGYNVHNFSATWLPEDMENLSVIVGVDNVFDEFYVSHASRTYSWTQVNSETGESVLFDTSDYEPGRNIKVTVSYRF